MGATFNLFEVGDILKLQYRFRQAHVDYVGGGFALSVETIGATREQDYPTLWAGPSSYADWSRQGIATAVYGHTDDFTASWSFEDGTPAQDLVPGIGHLSLNGQDLTEQDIARMISDYYAETRPQIYHWAERNTTAGA